MHHNQIDKATDKMSASRDINEVRRDPAGLSARFRRGRGTRRWPVPVLAALMFVMTGAAADLAGVDVGLVEFRQGRFAEAFETWRQAAGEGDGRGALYVGVLYDTGLGVRRDLGQAMAWYRRAAEAGSAPGAFNVGVFYDAGLGVPKDPAQAAIWYQRAASGGYGRAEYNLAMLSEAGVGVPKDRGRAIALYRSAASHGITASRLHLAGLGQPFAGASQPRRDTAMLDFERAQQILLARGPADAAQVAERFRSSAERGNALAAYDLGYCYEHGIGVPRDAVQAITWYRRAVAGVEAGPGNDLIRNIAQTGAGTLEGQLTQAQRRTLEPAPPSRAAAGAVIPEGHSAN